MDAATVRKIKNVGDEPAVYLCAGGKDGYVGRDGRLPEGETSRFGRRARARPRERLAPRCVGAGAGCCAAVALALAAGSPARPLPGAARCPVFPRDNHWNQRVDRLPVHAQLGRDRALASAPTTTMHADFGSGLYDGGPIGIPYVTVRQRPGAGAGELRVRGRVRPRPLPDPAAARRSRAAAAPTATAT